MRLFPLLARGLFCDSSREKISTTKIDAEESGEKRGAREKNWVTTKFKTTGAASLASGQKGVRPDNPLAIF